MEYLVEIKYQSIEEMMELEGVIKTGLFEIQKDFHFKIDRGSQGIVISQDFINATIRLKPLPDEMPEEMKSRIIELFQMHAQKGRMLPVHQQV